MKQLGHRRGSTAVTPPQIWGGAPVAFCRNRWRDCKLGEEPHALNEYRENEGRGGANWLLLDLHERQRVIMEDYLQTMKIADDKWRECFQSTSTCFPAERTGAPLQWLQYIHMIFIFWTQQFLVIKALKLNHCESINGPSSTENSFSIRCAYISTKGLAWFRGSHTLLNISNSVETP